MSDFTVSMRIAKPDEVKAVRSEAVRYLGYKNIKPDSAVMELIDVCEKELLKAVSPRYCFAKTKIDIIGDESVNIGFGEIHSRDLAKHLKDCHSVILMAATLGLGVDRLINKYSRIAPAKSVIIDALGSSAVEYWCDIAETELTQNEKNHCSRFSAGYGDFPLGCQSDFVRCLDMQRKLGVTLSDSFLMTPSKTVTAVIGLGGISRTCENKCASCANENCIYRR